MMQRIAISLSIVGGAVALPQAVADSLPSGDEPEIVEEGTDLESADQGEVADAEVVEEDEDAD